MYFENFGKIVQEKYRRFNRDIFKDKLPKEIHISLSDKMISKAGALYFYKFLNGDIEVIRLVISKRYIECFPFELDNVLLHEMIHIKLKNIGHERDFKREMTRINNKFGYDIKTKGYSMKNYVKYSQNEKFDFLEVS